MKTFTFAFCLIFAMGLGAGAQGQEMSPEDKAMMEAMHKAAAPGEPHKKLEAMVGEWEAHSKMWMDPAAPPQESKAKSTNKMLYDGRYLQQRYVGDMMGHTFRGLGFWGYDNLKKKFVSTWIDNGSTALTYSEGEWDAAQNAIVFHAEWVDPMTNKPVKSKIVVGIESADKHVFEMFMIDADGNEQKSMEIVYTKKKSETD